MKKRHTEMYMEIAETIAKQSYAERRKVGAVVVKDDRIISIGYNGTPPGADNTCEDWFTQVDETGNVVTYSKTKGDVIHAEMNAIYKLARNGESGLGADLFVTMQPCFECSKAILAVGFRKVWFREQYRDTAGVDLLSEYNIEMEQV